MRDFSEIFAKHYFSNHHTEARHLESWLEQVLPGCECVTFSSLPALLVAAVDELCDSEANLYAAPEPSPHALQALGLKRFLHATGRRQVLFAGQEEYTHFAEQARREFGEGDILPAAVLMEKGSIRGIFLDLAARVPILLSAGVFVTRDAELAEKIRWARSSYGRRKPACIHIAANGRFSELQAYLVNCAVQVEP